MPFQHEGPTVSAQIFQAPVIHPESSRPSSSSIIASKSNSVDPAKKSKTGSVQASSSLTTPGPSAPRKHHHVSFQEDPEPPTSNRRRGRHNRSQARHRSSDDNDFTDRDRDSEAGSSKPSTSRASSRQSRRDVSEPESSKSMGADSNPGSSSRSGRGRHRARSDRKSDRSSQGPSRSERSSKGQSEEESASVALVSRRSASPNSFNSEAKTREGNNNAPGRKGRHQSGQAIVPDLRNADSTPKSEPNIRGHPHSPPLPSSHHHHNSGGGNGGGRKDRFARSNEPRHAPGDPPTNRDGRQLFDPRRDDPVKFASQQRFQVDDRNHSAAGTSASSPRLQAAAATAPQILMRRDASSSSTAMTKSPNLRPALTEQSVPSLVNPNDPKSLQAHVIEFKKVYRMISLAESKLHETHRKEAEKEREAMGDYVPPDLRDKSYWVKLIVQHRDLAECCSTFLEMTCRPELPHSIQELAEVYNLPSRLWQTGFHLMLESLRHNLYLHVHGQDARKREAEILDHLTEFIYYAYSFYSTLHESERYKRFRRAWIESLGDLSRYRMSVAGLAASLSIDGGGGEIRNKSTAEGRAAEARIDDDDNDDSSSVQLEPDQADKASIGSAALGDWEWIEKETWRQTAKDWYAKATAETPATGRLHHHLGVLSKDNELRALYHLSKSLIAHKPFPNAKESLLNLFDQQRQSLRLRPDSSVEELFVYLHGILITRVQLDDFQSVFSKLLTKLNLAISERGTSCLPQSVWMMMACVNVASLMQYGAEDSVMMNLFLQDSGRLGQQSKRTQKSKSATPTAIMLNPTTNAKAEDNFLSELPRDAEWDDASDDGSEADGEDPQVITLESKTDDSDQTAEMPLVVQHAARLCFTIYTLAAHTAEKDARGRSNPYVTTLTTFLLSLCQSKSACRLIERFVRWDLWLMQIEQSVSLAERGWPKILSSHYINSKLWLPEDWCLRGIFGLSRQVYDRSLWKPGSSPVITSGFDFENEVEVLDCEDDEMYSRVESSRQASAAGDENKSTSLDTIRSYRVAFVARKLARAGRSFDLDAKTGRLSLSRFLIARLTRMKMEAEQRQLEEEIERLKLRSHQGDFIKDVDPDLMDGLFDSDEEAEQRALIQAAESTAATEEIRALQDRKCHLKNILRSLAARVKCAPHDATYRQADKRSCGKTSAVTSQEECVHVVPGYTVAVVDTNIIVTPGDLIQRLIDSQRWTIIVPLAVITELDGLRRNDNELGREAERAIQFLESRIKSHARSLKVQTSRGNYLCDLSIRSEDIDFAWQDGNPSSSALPPSDASSFPQHPTSEKDSKSIAARNVDEVILRILAWQRDHFTDRRSILGVESSTSVKRTAEKGESRHSGGKGDEVTSATQKSVLLTLDRNLRLKARMRGLASLDEKGISALMERTTF